MEYDERMAILKSGYYMIKMCTLEDVDNKFAIIWPIYFINLQYFKILSKGSDKPITDMMEKTTSISGYIESKQL